ncbi:hypothetical protein SEA_MARSHAWN_62 [Mycobacterium phage Marshawn]|uniref:Uncharacterized protein n=1 Tax=Mycobacterium phage Marshawn TaxID=2652423 RepID=A0A5P8D795_9CAUD|nr:hypothetical protein I5H02_gp37 [Mycobacterium phage Marshawn]QFP94848.1 hypothetical protein SEA_MARSHAWN_62 [Mycobacterium phage Marshawn]
MYDNDALNRHLWQSQMQIAAATERVQRRQITLLTTQQQIIDDQLADARRKHEQAVRDYEQAAQMIAGLNDTAGRAAAALMPSRDELAAWASDEHLLDLGKLLDDGKPLADNGEGIDDEAAK